MKLYDNTGIKLRDALNKTLDDLMKKYNINRTDARKLLAEAITRKFVWNEITETCDWLLADNPPTS